MINNHGNRHHKLQEAVAALESGRCVWCDLAPAGLTSHLCDGCRPEDEEGVFESR